MLKCMRGTKKKHLKKGILDRKQGLRVLPLFYAKKLFIYKTDSIER